MPEASTNSKETSEVNEPVVQVAVKTAPSGAEKVSDPDDPDPSVAFVKTGTPSAKIVIALPFHPSPHESSKLSVKEACGTLESGIV